MKTIKKRGSLLILSTIVGFFLTAGTLSTAAAADAECKAFSKDFSALSDKYEKILKKANKLAKKKDAKLNKLKPLHAERKRVEDRLKSILERNEKNREKCAKEWRKADKTVVKLRNLGKKNAAIRDETRDQDG